MTDHRDLWKRAETLFHQLADSTAEERNQRLAPWQRDDPQLYEEVRSLLEAFDAERQQAPASAGSVGGDGASADGEVDWLLKPDGVDDPWVGRTLGKYRLERLLGKGGMGAVYLASRVGDALQLNVAVKIVAARFTSDWLRDHFLQERQLLATFQHPHIARLLDGGFAESGEPYLVMEYIQGSSLERYCEQQRLAVGDVVRLFLQLCDAVAYTHRNLVVHRDLKPGNVLVDASGIVKLLDFGAAKLLDDRATEGPATRMGLRAFTPDYASPEQIFGQVVTASSDVYSLGVILYRLLSGRLPFEHQSRSSAGMARALEDTQPPPPSDAITRVAEQDGVAIEERRIRASQLRGDLDAIVLKALRAEPELRYRDVEAMMRDLRAYLQHRPVLAREGSRRYRARKFLRRHRLAVVVSMMVALVTAGGATATTLQARVALEEEARAKAGLQSVRRLSRLLLWDFYHQVQALPGSQQVQRTLAARALTYLDRLAEEASGDRELQIELVEAYTRLGDLDADSSGQGLSDPKGALHCYQQAMAVANAWKAEGPLHARERELVAKLLRSRGAVLQLLGQPEQASRDAREADELEQQAMLP
ncbi:MAG: serine/threonine protein kinase [Bryobacterales bacterium]|jgi:serine/threonine protein kinase|nr:serine/threonine protein kinase [Bryobacterales bacterium]